MICARHASHSGVLFYSLRIVPVLHHADAALKQRGLRRAKTDALLPARQNATMKTRHGGTVVRLENG